MSYTGARAVEAPQRFLIIESYPWGFYENDRLRGAAVEWLDDLAARHRLALAPVVTSHARGMSLLERGEIDYLVAPDSPRYRKLGRPAFPILNVSIMLVARPGIDLAALADLKSVAIVPGLAFDEIGMPRAEEMHPAIALRRMAAGRLDALIVSSPGLQAEARRQDISIQGWPQRPMGTVAFSLFAAPKTADHPQTPAVLQAIRDARDARSYAPFIARYLSAP